MFCPKCGSRLPDDALFCGECGQEISEKLRARMKNDAEKEVQEPQKVTQGKKEAEVGTTTASEPWTTDEPWTADELWTADGPWTSGETYRKITQAENNTQWQEKTLSEGNRTDDHAGWKYMGKIPSDTGGDIGAQEKLHWGEDQEETPYPFDVQDDLHNPIYNGVPIPQEEKKEKKFKPIYAAIIVSVFCIVVAASFLLSSGLLSKNDAGAGDQTETVAEGTTQAEEVTTGETAETTTEATEASTETTEATTAAPEGTTTELTEEYDVVTEGASETADYTNCKDLSNYVEVVSPEGDYSFCVPKGVYSAKSVVGDNITYSSGTGEDYVIFARYENTYGSAEEGKDGTYSKLIGNREASYEQNVNGDDGFEKKVGSYQENGNDYYFAVSAKEDYVYVMAVRTRNLGDDRKLGDYNVECLYSYCSFTKATDRQAYEDFLNQN